MRLHLFPTEGAFEVALEDFVRARPGISALEVGRALSSVPRLLREAAATTGAHPMGKLADTLIVRALCADGWGEGPMPASFAPKLGVVLSTLRRSGVTPGALRSVAHVLPPAAQKDAARLFAALSRYEQLLGDREDAAKSVQLALRALAEARIPSLVDVDIVELHDAAPIDPLARLVVEALAARGLTVRCRVPDAPPQQVEGAAARHEEGLVAAITAALDALEGIAVEGPGAVERVGAALSPGPVPSLIVLPTPELEAQAIARRVRDRIVGGATPDEIAVVAVSLEQRARITNALLRYGVPAERAVAPSLAETGIARLLTSLFAVVEARMTREALATLLSSRYLAAPHRPSGQPISHGRIGAVLRAALPITASRDAWRAALSKWVAAQPPSRQPDADAVAQHAWHSRERLESLPARATLAVHAESLRTLFAALGIAPSTATGVAEVEAASAHDRVAWRAVLELIAELPTAAKRSGLAERRFDRAEVSALLQHHLASTPMPHVGGRGAAVLVCDLDHLPQRALSLLVLGGMDETALEAHAEDLGVHEETQRTLGRALGRSLFAPPGAKNSRWRIRLAQSRARAAALLVTVTRVDSRGRVCLPGEVVAHARALGADEQRPMSSQVPRAEDARTRRELIARLLLEESGDLSARQGLTARTTEALRVQLRSPALTQSSERAKIERDREAFFARASPAGRYDGRIDDEAVMARLVERALPGRSARPLSASTLGQHAECPARFFFEAVVGARPSDEIDDELDERASGTLAHTALEHVFIAWRDAGLLPLSGRPEEKALIAPALDRAVTSWAALNATGNATLFEIKKRALGRLLEAVWRLEITGPPAPGLLPHAFELRFDALELPGGPPDAPPVYLRGSIDRFDLSSDGKRAAVFDYKSGALSSLTPRLKHEAFADSSWQLPLYAAVVRDRFGVDEVQMIYYALRDLRSSGKPAPDWLRLSSETPTSESLLSTRMWSRVVAMRKGRFEIEPRTKACEHCRMQPACRVVERRGNEDTTEEDGES